jgi:hypothetical protein
MIPAAVRRLEVFLCSEMGSSRWTALRSAVSSTVRVLGLEPLAFESFPPGPVEESFRAADLGIEAAKRADIVVAGIGETVTDPVGRELEAAFDRNPDPPVGLFFDGSVHRDERAQRLWDELKDQHVLRVFQSPDELQKGVAEFLVTHAHEARHNSGAPRSIAEEEIELEPGEEARRRWLLLPGDRATVTAVAIGSQHHFHFALADAHEFVARTRNLPYYDFAMGADKYSFHETARAEEAGFYFVVLRRPWWFHLGSVTVKLSVMLGRELAK